MTENLPTWIMQRYSKLWSKFNDREFTKEQAEKLLGKDNAIAVFFSDLRKAGWLEIRIDQADARKTIYKLKNPKQAISEVICNNLTSVQKDNMVFDGSIRRLTPIECERLQGFPDNWTEGFSDTQRYKMMGNAVTVNVIRAISLNLLSSIKAPKPKDI